MTWPTDPAEIEERRFRAEESIRKKFHKQLFTPFAKACKTYRLISEGDHIAVCISGGKDSMLMAKLFQEIKKHRQCNFELSFLVMDPGYNAKNRELIEYNAQNLGIPVTIFESDIFDAVDTLDKNPCYICAWRDYNDLHFLQCACHFTETCETCREDGTSSSKRLETKRLIAELKKNNPFIESNIFKSVENVNLDTVIGYKKDGVRHHFLDEY